jgi:glycosyltransferase involved in cell wall biosynthesis
VTGAAADAAEPPRRRAGGRTVSVVIPTRDRRETLGATLDALSEQRFPLDRLEVVVVADGCTDGTPAMVRGYRAPFALRLVEQPALGAARARNAGAAAADAPLLVFLDDDVVPDPGLVAAHAAAQARAPGCLVMGYSRPAVPVAVAGGGASALWRQRWEERFRTMGATGHRFAFRDLRSGNLSIAAALFAAAGGFDEGMECRADSELGARLLEAGVAFAFEPAAAGEHRHPAPAALLPRQRRAEGRGDVQLGLRHPSLRPELRLARVEADVPPLEGALRALAFTAPRLGDVAARVLGAWLNALERLRARRRWRRLHATLGHYWYWRGAAEQAGGRRALADFLHGGDAAVAGEWGWGGEPLEVELQAGLADAARALDAARPAGARLRYAGQAVGEIPARPGAERLRGAHLRPALSGDPTAWRLLLAMTLAGASSPDGRATSFAADGAPDA